MRSSKKRSRSSQNRPRTLGNIVNRVFDSSGPEGKVRGTPQQIIEKYQMLARDAQLSNDRVAAENFLQHAEHYTRMLAEAMREMAAEQEARQQQYQQNPGQNGGQNGGQNPGHGQGGQPRGEGRDRPDRQGDRPERNAGGDRGEDRREPRPDRDYAPAAPIAAPDVIELDAGDETGLVETPEAQAQLRAAAPGPAPEAEGAAPAERTINRRPRGPRKPRPEAAADAPPPQEAAE
jgi:hypothetical protein